VLCWRVATALAFVAAARPQYGKGTRFLPATKLDVVVVLDYSKSMYAQDVEPSRIFRAKVEVARLIEELAGARFAAVAFAGEPMGFPLTATRRAVAQFLRSSLDPNDMPSRRHGHRPRAVAGARSPATAIPISQDHKRVRSSWSPTARIWRAIRSAWRGKSATRGRPSTWCRSAAARPSPSPRSGRGRRRGRLAQRPQSAAHDDRALRPGEKQLADDRGRDAGRHAWSRRRRANRHRRRIGAELSQQMKSELGERVEDVYADVYEYPLGLAILLLVVELLLTDAPRRVLARRPVPPKKKPSPFAEVRRGS
jgi:Ca-activated chloride channel family protein